MGEIFKQAIPASKIVASESASRTFALLGVSPFHLSGDGTLTWAEPELASRLLRGADALLPRTEAALKRRLEPAFARARKTARQSLTWDGARYSVQYQIDLFDGQKLWVEERGQRLSGLGKTATNITATLADIDDRKRDEAKAVYRATNDPLTGLWNEACLRNGLVFLQAASRKFYKPCVFLRLRMSNLGDINTSYGYDAGDRVIKAVGARLTEAFPAPHMLARIGSVSFALSLLDCHTDEVVARVQKILQRLSDVPYPTPHGDLYAEFHVSSVAIDPEGNSDIDTLFVNSDIAMQSAIASGQKYVAYSPSLAPKPNAKSQQATSSQDIISALNDRRVSLAYQPIVEAKTRKLHHYECLLRLKRDDGEIVSAGEFVMAAERLGLVHLLDRRALEIAAQTLTRYPDIELALNVSAATVKSADSANAYLEGLRALGPATSRVTIELTETVALEDPAMASRFSVEARMLGCMFSIDDFGSGHTTFQNLMAIEADSIKIDGSFIKDLSITPHKQTFVRMMVDLAQTFSVKTVAEMVETREDAELLNRLGVDYLQGYLFGVPSAAPAWQGS